MDRWMKPIFLATGAGLLLWHQHIQNHSLKTVDHQLAYTDLPESLEGFRIVQISDLHGAEFGPENRRLAERIDSLRPDILCMTGDMVHARGDDGTAVFNLLRHLKGDYPRLYITGNHEIYRRRLSGREEIERQGYYSKLEENGVIVLRNMHYDFPDLPITFYGVEDNVRYYKEGGGMELLPEPLLGKIRTDTFAVGLVHRPNHFQKFQEAGIRLMLSGHTHGGIIRLPMLGGVLSPDRILFPAYDKGMFKVKDAYLHVSSGLGNSKPMVKVGNRPEVIRFTLKGKK